MSKIPIFIDCDPGTDDIVALLIANAMPEIDIVGISAVCGNVECEKTYKNAHISQHIAGKNVPIYKGADKPIMIDLVDAKYVHGEDGLSGNSAEFDIEIPAPPKEWAWDAIYREAKKYNGELVLVAVGPMTNVAIALAKYKDLPKYLNKIVIMGGSVGCGNITPSAEFNIYVDPEAAEIMFKCGVPIYMFGLDVTEKAYLLPEELERIGQLGSKPAKFIHKVLSSNLDFYLKAGNKGNFMHDPCAIMYLVYPELFEGKLSGVCVETKGKITKGRTVCDYYIDNKFVFQNSYVFVDVKRNELIEKIIEILSRY